MMSDFWEMAKGLGVVWATFDGFCQMISFGLWAVSDGFRGLWACGLYPFFFFPETVG